MILFWIRSDWTWPRTAIKASFKTWTILSSQMWALLARSTRRDTQTAARARRRNTKRSVSLTRSYHRGKSPWKLCRQKITPFLKDSKYFLCLSSSIMEKISFRGQSFVGCYWQIIRRLLASEPSNVWTISIKKLLASSTRSILSRNRYHKNGFNNNIINKIQIWNNSCELTRARLTPQFLRRGQRCATLHQNSRLLCQARNNKWLSHPQEESKLLTIMVNWLTRIRILIWWTCQISLKKIWPRQSRQTW